MIPAGRHYLKMIDKGNLSEKKGTVNSRKEAYMKQT